MKAKFDKPEYDIYDVAIFLLDIKDSVDLDEDDVEALIQDKYNIEIYELNDIINKLFSNIHIGTSFFDNTKRVVIGKEIGDCLKQCIGVNFSIVDKK